MQSFRNFFNRIRSNDRGVGMVEYSLVIATLLVGTSTTFDMMDERIEEHYVDTASDIGQSDLDVFNVTTTTSAPSSTTSSTTTTTTTTTAAPTSTTTTAAPTTTTSTTTTTTAAPTSTTTTAAPTTTTTTAPTPTTTVAPDETSDTTFRDRTSLTNDGWKAKVRVKLKDEDGDELEEATVVVTFTLQDGSTATSTGETNDDGRITFQWPGLDAADFPVTVHIDSITGDNGTTYGPDQNDFVLTTG